MIARLQAIVDRLLRNWTATPRPRVAIFVMPDRSYGGDAAGQNQLFVNTGLLQRAANEDEIAFVLAHELAHVLRGHINERQQGIKTGNGMISFASMGSTYGIMLAHIGQQQLSRGATAAVLAAFQIGQILLAANESVGDAGWSRAQEYEADELGLDLLINSHYYNPDAYLNAFDRLIAESKELAQQRAELKGTVTTAIDLGVALAFGKPNGNTSPLSPGATAALVSAVFAAPGVEKMFDAILPAGTHPPERDRKEALQKYEASLWPEVDAANSKPNPFVSGGELAGVMMPAYDAVKTAAAANDAITKNDFATARSLVGQPDLGQAMPEQQRMLRAKLALGSGDSGTAIQQLQVATRDPAAPASSYTLLANAQAAGRQYDAALSTLDVGQRRFDSEEGFLPYRIAILREAGRDKDVANALQRCQSIGGSELVGACRQAAKPPETTGPSVSYLSGRSPDIKNL
jgi:Zn-dependent protease with chaperone function